MKDPTVGEANFCVALTLVLGITIGYAFTKHYYVKQAIQANVAHYELVGSGPEIQFKWGPKP